MTTDTGTPDTTNGATTAPIGASGEVADNPAFGLHTEEVRDSEPQKPEVEVFMGELTASDLEKRLNAGWEKWHAEFKGSKLYVAMTRNKSVATVQPQPAVAKSVEPPAPEIKPVEVPEIILPPIDSPIYQQPVITQSGPTNHVGYLSSPGGI